MSSKSIKKNKKNEIKDDVKKIEAKLFFINSLSQMGKTTLLTLLHLRLKNDYKPVTLHLKEFDCKSDNYNNLISQLIEKIFFAITNRHFNETFIDSKFQQLNNELKKHSNIVYIIDDLHLLFTIKSYFKDTNNDQTKYLMELLNIICSANIISFISLSITDHEGELVKDKNILQSKLKDIFLPIADTIFRNIGTLKIELFTLDYIDTNKIKEYYYPLIKKIYNITFNNLDDTISTIYNLSGGLPFWFQLIFSHIVKYCVNNNISTINADFINCVIVNELKHMELDTFDKHYNKLSNEEKDLLTEITYIKKDITTNFKYAVDKHVLINKINEKHNYEQANIQKAINTLIGKKILKIKSTPEILNMDASSNSSDYNKFLTINPLIFPKFIREKNDVRIVHLSDTHIGKHDSFVLKAAIEKINIIRPHILIITGDITESGKPEEFIDASREFNEIDLAYLSNSPKHQRMIIGFGNHDYHKNADVPPAHDAKVKELFPYTGMLSPNLKIEIKNINFEIFYFHSTPSKKRKYKAKGIVSELQLKDIMNNKLIAEKPSNNTIRIAALHHSPTEINDSSVPLLIRRYHNSLLKLKNSAMFLKFLTDYKFHMILHGHFHLYTYKRCLSVDNFKTIPPLSIDAGSLCKKNNKISGFNLLIFNHNNSQSYKIIRNIYDSDNNIFKDSNSGDFDL